MWEMVFSDMVVQQKLSSEALRPLWPTQVSELGWIRILSDIRRHKRLSCQPWMRVLVSLVFNFIEVRA
jgi:hypothetical protein